MMGELCPLYSGSQRMPRDSGPEGGAKSRLSSATSDDEDGWLVEAALVLLGVVVVGAGVVAIITNRKRMSAIRTTYCNTKTIDKTTFM